MQHLNISISSIWKWNSSSKMYRLGVGRGVIPACYFGAWFWSLFRLFLTPAFWMFQGALNQVFPLKRACLPAYTYSEQESWQEASLFSLRGQITTDFLSCLQNHWELTSLETDTLCSHTEMSIPLLWLSLLSRNCSWSASCHFCWNTCHFWESDAWGC